jgi:hypothetical protein
MSGGLESAMAKRQIDRRWSDVRSALATQSSAQFLGLVRDLYDLSQENRDLLNARYLASENSLEPYKKAIADAIYPNVYKSKPIRISVAKKAINQYTKATGDQAGTLELMVYFVERGNRFTVDFGDINAGFYSSLESMFGRILETLKGSDPEVVERLLPRLVAIRDAAKSIGWGYYDYLCDVLAEAFPRAAEDEATTHD